MRKILTVLTLVVSIYANANVELPLLFNDGMVLQRNQPIPVWGWANANERIEVHFKEQVVKTKTDKQGKWSVRLKPETAGGPYELTVKGKNTITIKDVLVGEVWLCSGQSNMEFSVSQAMNAEQEIKNSNYPLIRQFLVEKEMSSTPKEQLKSGIWQASNPATVGNFTAVGYFCAKKLYQELKIPIGIINASWGGTCVETWTSREGFENSDEFKDMISKYSKIDMDSLAEKQKKTILDKIESIQGSKPSLDKESSFKAIAFDDSNWPEMQAPKLWEHQQFPNLDGVVWMRKSIVVSKEDADKEATLELAKIDDDDVTYINGVEVGTTIGYDKKRIYNVPAGVLKEGSNSIAVRITDYTGGGGIWGDASNLKLTLQNTVIPLAGQWKFNVVEIKSEVSPNSYPSLLYNAMIYPLIPYSIQGVLWYQGEANVSRAQQYKKAFPLMINDWRSKWNQGDFTFYFVQLSSYDEFGGNSNKGSKWAELREAQSFTLETVPNTGMAVTVDIGNAKDIHPTNKQDVGKRLAAIALHDIYKHDIVFSGPIFKSMEKKENKIILTFDTMGSGLMTTDKYGYIKGFEIVGENNVFYYAKASISGNKVIVYSDKVNKPIAVHYGWSDDAGDCNLYNKEGFPASPFRTDNWDGITNGKKYIVEK
ncbi:sialate O-acetylesterase [Yeosuana marina]|uniref:sialate O-acetylesterase n=1 Tax=Yeosuana marina TaxID=1565536 RepID=UPI0030C7DAC5